MYILLLNHFIIIYTCTGESFRVLNTENNYKLNVIRLYISNLKLFLKLKGKFLKFKLY